MNNSIQKFQDLLRELFQFDSADLDFGIYRIMNHKRQVIEQFIHEDLPKAVREELERDALAGQLQAVRELEEITTQIKQNFGAEVIDVEGKLDSAYHNTPLGRKYLETKSKAAGTRGREALEATIYNHLYAFFSRYYQDGDFISKRRYSKRERYAIPYNGEEVYLYWANHGQYYVKTGEYFTDYTFTAPNGVTVHFKLQTADVEQNNVKGEKRFFLLRPADLAWDEAARQLVIPFDYRPLSEQDSIAYGQKNQQDSILADALEKLPKRLSPKTAAEALAALHAEKRKTIDGGSVTFLEHHLRQYTRRNTSDFFIHKDLKSFLSRELDFYLKNEVLNLDEMEASGEGHAEGWFQILRAIKAVGSRIIEFLHQIEEFQKLLWEKRKFITEVQYCITLRTIAEDFYPEIAACEPQWNEWKDLFHIDEEEAGLFTGKDKQKKRLALLKARPTLVLDTKHFEFALVDRLLGSFDDLDEITDGLLVHSKNWQALNLLTSRYHEQVKCIHIDPPYNTQSSGFLYKNDYQHSSWLSMMKDRLAKSTELLEKPGVLACHIDEYEMEHLHLLLEQTATENAGTLVWDKGMPTTGAHGIATQHEYVLFRTKGDPDIRIAKKNIATINAKTGELLTKFGAPTKDAISEYRQWLRSQTGFSKSELTYDQFDESGRAFRSDNMSATDRRTHDKFYKPLMHPITGKPCPVPEYGWRYTPESMSKLLEEGLILFGEDHLSMPRKKTYLEHTTTSQVPSIFRSGSRGKVLLDTMGLEFPFAHAIDFYKQIIGASSESGDLVLDYFAGSGTTGHAVINLNREDDIHREFILVELADYFDTVLLPRIKKATFTPEWKEGKPERMATAEEAELSPRIIKYLRLESYEDALNNIAFDDAAGQQPMKFDDYLLQYMLKWETRASETLLNVEKLSEPFHYKLHIHANGQTRERLVDIPETFNYLLGLQVQTRRVYEDNGRRYLVYRGTLRVDQRRVVILWRETRDWQKADYERDRDFVAEQKLTKGADEIFVNGDSLSPGARALEPVFKARMLAPVEA